MFPETRWRVSKRNREHLKSWDKFVSIAERVLRETSTGYAPWYLIEGNDKRHARINILETFCNTLDKAI